MKWKFFVGVAISVVLFFLAVRNVKLDELVGALKNIKYHYLGVAVFMTLLSLFIRSIRWHYLIRPIKSIKIVNLFSVTMIGFMTNNLFPVRLGEFARAYLIGEKENISKSASFATVVLDRVFDGLVILLFLALIVLLFPFSFPEWLKSASYIGLVIYIFTLIFLILLKIKTSMVTSFVSLLLRPFPDKIGNRITNLMTSFVTGLKILHDRRNILISILLSVALWIPVILSIYFLLMSFDIILPFYASVVLMIIICLGMMIPSAPGYIGTVHFACVAGLALFGVPKTIALSFSIVFHASQFIPITAVGLVCFLIEGFSFSQIDRSSKSFLNN